MSDEQKYLWVSELREYFSLAILVGVRRTGAPGADLDLLYSFFVSAFVSSNNSRNQMSSLLYHKIPFPRSILLHQTGRRASKRPMPTRTQDETKLERTEDTLFGQDPTDRTEPNESSKIVERTRTNIASTLRWKTANDTNRVGRCGILAGCSTVGLGR